MVAVEIKISSLREIIRDQNLNLLPLTQVEIFLPGKIFEPRF